MGPFMPHTNTSVPGANDQRPQTIGAHYNSFGVCRQLCSLGRSLLAARSNRVCLTIEQVSAAMVSTMVIKAFTGLTIILVIPGRAGAARLSEADRLVLKGTLCDSPSCTASWPSIYDALTSADIICGLRVEHYHCMV